jgi:acetyl-CoA carboxylase biotin carboxyl carrier protein
VDFDNIQKVASLMQEMRLTYFEYQGADYKFTIKREESQKPAAASAAHPGLAPPMDVVAKNYASVPSPAIGTIYLKDSDGIPFVSEGSIVLEGDVLCRIEAMKMFSDIKSPYSGKIINVLVGDSELVEFDMPLFSIERTDD